MLIPDWSALITPPPSEGHPGQRDSYPIDVSHLSFNFLRCYSRYLSQCPHPAHQGTFAANTNFVTDDTVHVGEKENHRLYNYK
jgi:hypothetical protein